jgi:hypothetical protein
MPCGNGRERERGCHQRKTAPHPPLRGTFSHGGEKEPAFLFRRILQSAKEIREIFPGLVILMKATMDERKVYFENIPSGINRVLW